MVVSHGTAQELAVNLHKNTLRAFLMLVIAGVGFELGVARAEPDDPAPAPRRPMPGIPSAPGVGAVASTAGPASTPGAASPTTGPHFASEDRWEHAGYNQDEIVYTVFITNHDPNILRCRTEVRGFYFNNGQKGEISDIQVSTVFPDKQVQAGIWSGLDEGSGATYKVSCRSL
jgi:hypothetical protein